MKNIIDVSLAGLTFSCRLRYPETARYFPAPDPAALRVGGDPVCLTDEDWQYYLADDMEDCAHTEFSLLTASFSDALMDYDRIILHAVAIRWRDKAYLITARSGVGKSTQARFLRELRPGEFGVICGDRPVLEFCKGPDLISVKANARMGPGAASDGRPTVSGAPTQNPGPPPADVPSVIVHPSHWNGKENWYGAEAAPLGGIILLNRGEENRLVQLSPREAAIRVYAQIIQICSEPERIRKAAELTTRLMNSVPIWQLTSFQVPDSTRLLLESLFPANPAP